MYHYTIKFHNLTNPTLSPIEISFTGSRLKAKYYIFRYTWILTKVYKQYNLKTHTNLSLYDVIYYDKNTGEQLIGVTMSEEEVPPGDIKFST